MSRYYCLAAAILVVLCIGVAGQAQASILSYSQSIPSTETDWGTNQLFPKFDSSAGTLESVTIALSGNMATVFTITNTTANPNKKASGIATSELGLNVANAGTTLASLGLNVTFHFNQLAGGSSVTSGTLTASNSQSITITAVDVLAAFTGDVGETISLLAETLTTTSIHGGGGNLAFDQTTIADLTTTITYEYEAGHAVPEPCAIGIWSVLGGVGAVVGWRRRKLAA